MPSLAKLRKLKNFRCQTKPLQLFSYSVKRFSLEKYLFIMKKLKLLFVFLLIPFLSCKNDEIEMDNSIYNTWEITDFISVESRLYAKDKDYNPLIEILKDGSFNLELDVNHCCGNFEINSNQKIKFSGAGCTKICCDSEFSLKFIQMLSQVEGYELEGNSMKLDVPGWGWIQLELYK